MRGRSLALLSFTAAPLVAQVGSSVSLRDAIDRGDVRGASTAIVRGANVHAYDDCGMTPLSEAAVRNDAQIIALLLLSGADPNAVTVGPGGSNRCGTVGGESPLELAVRQGREAAVVALLRSGRAAVDARGRDETTPLMLAASLGETRIVEELLEAGASANLLGGRPPRTALALAALQGNKGVVTALLASGASPDLGDQEGATFPLCEALQNGHGDVASALLTVGASVAVDCGSSSTPLTVAMRRYPSLVSEIVRRGGRLGLRVWVKIPFLVGSALIVFGFLAGGIAKYNPFKELPRPKVWINGTAGLVAAAAILPLFENLESAYTMLVTVTGLGTSIVQSMIGILSLSIAGRLFWWRLRAYFV